MYTPEGLHQRSRVCLQSKFFHMFFFFQAEDGIRDLIVTGVQTCALPISFVAYFSWCVVAIGGVRAMGPVEIGHERIRRLWLFESQNVTLTLNNPSVSEVKIGRASCRERV